MLPLAPSTPNARPGALVSADHDTDLSPRLASLVRVSGAVLLLISVAEILGYLFVAMRTLGYPYPLEWMEGGTLDVVDRVLRGLPIYTRPTPEYVPYLYTPLYFLASALTARVVGLDFFAARLVSFVAIVGVCACLWLIVRRETNGNRLYALAAVATFIGTYEATDRWFHVARVDSLFLMLLLAAFCVLRLGRGIASAVLCGVLLWLSFATKQTALVCALVALPVMAFDSWRRPAIAACVLTALVVATNAVMHVWTDGWWTFFVYDIARDQKVQWWTLYAFVSSDIARVLPVGVVGLVAMVVLKKDAERSTRWLLGLFAGLILTAALARANTGGAGNALMPAYAALSMALPIGFARLGRTPWAQAVLALVLAAQVLFPISPTAAAFPTTADREAGDRYVEFLRGIDGEVMVFTQRFVETRAGKKSWGLAAATDDVLTSSKRDVRRRLRDDILRELTSGRVAGVIDPPVWVRDRVPLGPPVSPFASDAGFWTLSGTPKRPSLYYPIAPAPSDH